MIDFAQSRQAMVENQIRPSDVTDLRVLGALREIPRERFVPASRQAFAYIDEDLLVRESEAGKRYLMEPAPFARLVQMAGIGPRDLVLDIGCATGYSTAIMARLAESVVALESDPDLAAGAERTLLDLGVTNAALVQGPLPEGYAAEGPYDAIVLEGAVDFVPDTLFDQLKDGGRLVAVLGQGRTARATLFRRVDDEVAGQPYFDCAVAPLPGFSREPGFVF